MMTILVANGPQVLLTLSIFVGVALFHIHLRAHDNDRADYKQGTVSTLMSIALLIGAMISAFSISVAFGVLCVLSTLAFALFVGMNTLAQQE